MHINIYIYGQNPTASETGKTEDRRFLMQKSRARAPCLQNALLRSRKSFDFGTVSRFFRTAAAPATAKAREEKGAERTGSI